MKQQRSLLRVNQMYSRSSDEHRNKLFATPHTSNPSVLSMGQIDLDGISTGKDMNSYREKLNEILYMQSKLQKEKEELEKISRRKISIFQAYNEKPSSSTDAKDLRNTSIVYSFPPTYFFYAIVSMIFFCFPVGLYAVHQSRKAQRAIEQLDVRTARKQAIAAHRFATLAVCYGVSLYFSFGIIFGFSNELRQYLV